MNLSKMRAKVYPLFICFGPLLLPFLFLHFLLMSAVGAQDGDYEFQASGGTATILRYLGPGGDVAIPDQLGGRTVVTVGTKAFYGIESLTKITIPKSISSIRFQAFSYCTNLVAIEVDALNPNYSSLDGVLFDKTQSVIHAYPGGKVGAYAIPDHVTAVWPYAFEGGIGLTGVAIPNNVTKISYKTFSGCAALTSATIGNGVTTIEGLSFEACTSLTSVSIPNNVTNIWMDAFSRCTNLTAIDVNALNPVYASVDGVLSDKPQGVLLLCPQGKAGVYAIPNSVTSIGTYAFFECVGLTSVTIPNSIVSVGSAAFSGCTGLTNATIPNSVSVIANSMFYGCTGLTGINIPNSVTLIGSSAFLGCTGLENVTIPNSVTSIGNSAFWSCTALASVTIPNSVISIGDSAFIDCTRLMNITIPNSITSIGNSVFSGCTSLTNVVIPNSVTSIGTAAFTYCSGLKSVHIPNSVISIGSFGFGYCIGLKSVTIPNSLNAINENVFSSCSGLTNITIPASVTSIGNSAFSHCTGLKSVVIPDSVTLIESKAFQYCTSLTSIYFEGNAPSLNGDPFDSFPFATFVTVFYRPGTTGWGDLYGGRPTAVWTTLSGYDTWAVNTGLTTLFPDSQGEIDDPDIDGFTNRSEWLAGTDPTHSASHLELEFTPRPADLSDSDKIPIPVDRHAVYFRSVPGRYYGVQRATVLGGEWELQAVRVASTSQTRFVLWAPDSQVYYRVIVLP
jgi:predicted nucleic acid-binding Zn finger protein